MQSKVSVFLLTAVAIVLIVCVAGQAQSTSLLTRHTRDVVVMGEAQSLGRLPATQIMNLDLMLPLRHQPELENFIEELYNPSSPSYRQYLTVPQFTARFGPSREDYDAVVGFAKENGFKIVDASARNRMIVQVKGSVATVEKAFHVQMGLYQHPTENRAFYAPDREPSANLSVQLWHVSGLDNYSIPHTNLRILPEGAHANVAGSCPGSSYCGSDMRAAYYGGSALDGTGQSVGLFEYLGTNLSDLNTYYQNVHQTLNTPITLISTDGTSVNCNAPNCDDTEQTIDMTQALGMAPNLAALNMYIGSRDTSILNAMATHNPLDANLSCSWYWGPADPKSLDPIFQEYATQGQNFFDAAGDNKSWQVGGSIWPADDAYLVSVGGTDLVTQSAGGPWKSETGWSDSGGGVSPNHIAIPSWQVAAAAGCASCSQTLRNGPDVAAESNFDFYYCSDQSGCGHGLGGTSFAAPMWAGYLALANQQAVANGQPTLGFINPALYQIGLSGNYTTDFHDIVSGNNGYSATTGYDLVTGWGSPNGSALIDALTGPQGPSFSLTASPNQLSIAENSQGTSTITVVPAGGFSGSVTLAASNLPSGVTAQFNPNPTSTTSTLTLTVSASAAPGTSTITVGGTSGSLSASTTIQLTITASGPVVSLTPTSLTWGKVVVGHTAAAKKVTLTNTGASTLNISGIATTGDFTLFSFTSKKKCSSTLAAGKSCIVKVNFTPTQTGLRTGSLNFTDNAPGSPQSVALSGTGK
ncbi:MAG TPA: protease pro-enzyme activation domain-containing protein [Terriglobales bacterium]|nr:protease pro-enzyme activation domain-containing protein [Terriglobales bacterium]